MFRLNTNHYAVTEANYFTRNVELSDENCIPLPEATFDRLQQFIKEQTQTTADGTS